MNNEQLTMNNEQLTMNNEQWTMNNEQLLTASVRHYRFLKGDGINNKIKYTPFIEGYIY